MIENNFYMHNKSMDVCIKIISRSYRITLDYKLIYIFEIEWWNLGYNGKPWKITENTNIIELKNLHNWFNISKCLNKKRTKPGIIYENN